MRYALYTLCMLCVRWVAECEGGERFWERRGEAEVGPGILHQSPEATSFR